MQSHYFIDKIQFWGQMPHSFDVIDHFLLYATRVVVLRHLWGLLFLHLILHARVFLV
jgi:hypothetical protein